MKFSCLFSPLGIFFLKKYLFIFRERRREGEREGEKHQCVVASLVRPLLGTWPETQACALTRNWTHDPLVHRSVLNPLNHTSQGSYVHIFTVGHHSCACFVCAEAQASVCFWAPPRVKDSLTKPECGWLIVLKHVGKMEKVRVTAMWWWEYQYNEPSIAL